MDYWVYSRSYWHPIFEGHISGHDWCANPIPKPEQLGSWSTGSDSGNASYEGESDTAFRILSKSSQKGHVDKSTSFRAHFPKISQDFANPRLTRLTRWEPPTFWIWKNHLMRSPTYCTRPECKYLCIRSSSIILLSGHSTSFNINMKRLEVSTRGKSRWLVVIIVIASIAFSFLLMGSPTHMLLEKLPTNHGC